MKDNYKKLLITIAIWILYVVWILKISSTELSIANFLLHVIFLLLIVIINRQYLKDCLKNLKKDKHWLRTIILYTLLFFIIMFVSNALITVISNATGITLDTDTANTQMNKMFNIVPFGTLFVVFLTCIFYPFIEELIFRKSLKDYIGNAFLFVLISSLLTWYFQVSISSPKIPEFILALTSLFNSIFAAVILVKKNNILYTIFPRMLFNLIISIIQVILLAVAV